MSPDPPAIPPTGPPRGRHRITLTGSQETLVIPLYARALDYRSRHPILNDAKSEEMVRSIDYDFSRLGSPGGRLLAVRARQLDEWTREFLATHPSAVVLNLGCGLDPRISRIHPPDSVAWFDVDFPEVIALRREFFEDGASYRMIGSSILAPEWLSQIPRDRPLLGIADGVLAYLPPNDVRSLLNRLTDAFASGELIFDVMSPAALRMGNARLQEKAGALLRWGVADLAEVEALDPRLRRKSVSSVLGSRYLPLALRLAYGVAILVPSARRAIRMVRYDFP